MTMATKNSKKTIETGHNSNVHKAINLRPVSNRSTFPYWAKINIPQKITRAKGSKFLPKKEKQKLRLKSFNLWIITLHVKPLSKGVSRQWGKKASLNMIWKMTLKILSYVYHTFRQWNQACNHSIPLHHTFH